MPDAPLEQFEAVTGRANDVSVTVTGLTYRPTSKGPRWAFGEFGSELIGALHEQLPRPKVRGVFRLKLRCPGCDRSLDDVAVRQVAVALDVDLRRMPPFHLDVTMPGVACPGCDRRLVMIHDGDLESDLSDALIDVFNRTGLSPG